MLQKGRNGPKGKKKVPELYVKIQKLTRGKVALGVKKGVKKENNGLVEGGKGM